MPDYTAPALTDESTGEHCPNCERGTVTDVETTVERGVERRRQPTDDGLLGRIKRVVFGGEKRTAARATETAGTDPSRDVATVVVRTCDNPGCESHVGPERVHELIDVGALDPWDSESP